jgi:hypothetical protein
MGDEAFDRAERIVDRATSKRYGFDIIDELIAEAG